MKRHQKRFDDQTFDNAQAAEYIGVEPSTLNTWRCTKRFAIPFVKVGSKVRYLKSDLDDFLASRYQTAG